jgi:hypothetical protein
MPRIVKYSFLLKTASGEDAILIFLVHLHAYPLKLHGCGVNYTLASYSCFI